MSIHQIVQLEDENGEVITTLTPDTHNDFIKQVQDIISPYIKLFTTEISLLEKNKNENCPISTPDVIKMNIIYKNQKSRNSLAILLRKY